MGSSRYGHLYPLAGREIGESERRAVQACNHPAVVTQRRRLQLSKLTVRDRRPSSTPKVKVAHSTVGADCAHGAPLEQTQRARFNSERLGLCVPSQTGGEEGHAVADVGGDGSVGRLAQAPHRLAGGNRMKGAELASGKLEVVHPTRALADMQQQAVARERHAPHFVADLRPVLDCASSRIGDGDATEG